MIFFLDTGIVEEIRTASEWGIVDGVTTNPSLIAKTGRSQRDVIKEITTIIDGPISAEVLSMDVKGMLREAEELASIHPNVVIKLPMTEQGISACKILASQKIKTNVTLCFSPVQALLAAKAQATYISPFVGRLDDVSQDGIGLVREIRAIFDNYGFETQILAASIRHPMHVRDCALAGADVGTMPFSVMKSLYRHPLTDKGLTQFLEDFNKSKK